MTRTSHTSTAQPSSAASAQSAIAAPNRARSRSLGATVQNGEEETTTLENDPSVLSDANLINPAHLNTDGQERPPAVDLDELADNPGPPVKRYRVIRGGRVQTSKNGLRTTLNEGKEIDANNYDIGLLKSQGVKLEEISLEATG